jgi:hypothetical protein
VQLEGDLELLSRVRDTLLLGPKAERERLVQAVLLIIGCKHRVAEGVERVVGRKVGVGVGGIVSLSEHGVGLLRGGGPIRKLLIAANTSLEFRVLRILAPEVECGLAEGILQRFVSLLAGGKSAMVVGWLRVDKLAGLSEVDVQGRLDLGKVVDLPGVGEGHATRQHTNLLVVAPLRNVWPVHREVELLVLGLRLGSRFLFHNFRILWFGRGLLRWFLVRVDRFEALEAGLAKLDKSVLERLR